MFKLWKFWLFFLLSLALNVASQDDPPTGFGIVTLAGGNTRTDFTFTDGMGLDLFSSTEHQMNVTSNPNPPAPGTFVTALDPFTGALGGGPWVAVQNHSYIFQAQGPAEDLTAKIELFWKQEELDQTGVVKENTFVGQFNQSRGGWVVDVARTNLHTVENRTRLVTLTSLDGEYILLGRQILGPDIGNTYLQFGSEVIESNFNVSTSPGIQALDQAPLQIAKWIDGFMAQVQSTQNMVMFVDVKNSTGDGTTIQSGFEAATLYGYNVTTTLPSGGSARGVFALPFNPTQVSAKGISTSDLFVAALDPATNTYVPDLAANAKIVSRTGFSAALSPIRSTLGGQYLLVARSSGSPVLDNSTSTTTKRQAVDDIYQGTPFVVE